MTRDETATYELIYRFVRGDPIAQVRLFEKYRAALIRRAQAKHRSVMTRMSLGAEDFVSEVFERALSSKVLERFDDPRPGALRGTLYAILDRVACDWDRRAKTRKRCPPSRGTANDGGHSIAEELEPRANDSQPGARLQAREVVDRCRERVDAKDWQLMEWSVLDGLSLTEIAKREGVTSAAIRGRVERLRKRLTALFPTLPGSGRRP